MYACVDIYILPAWARMHADEFPIFSARMNTFIIRFFSISEADIVNDKRLWVA